MYRFTFDVFDFDSLMCVTATDSTQRGKFDKNVAEVKNVQGFTTSEAKKRGIAPQFNPGRKKLALASYALVSCNLHASLPSMGISLKAYSQHSCRALRFPLWRLMRSLCCLFAWNHGKLNVINSSKMLDW